MAVVTVYEHVQKPGREGGFKLFTPLRAVGLSLEEGWKASRNKGLNSVSIEDLQRVRLSGSLRLFSDEQWRACSCCTLVLKPRDAALALKLLRMQRSLLSVLIAIRTYKEFFN